MTSENLSSMADLVSLCKRRGFLFQSSEVYGGMGGFWDYGPLGVELKMNVKNTWWKEMTLRKNIVGVDASIIMHPSVWKASGTWMDLLTHLLIVNSVKQGLERTKLI